MSLHHKTSGIHFKAWYLLELSDKNIIVSTFIMFRRGLCKWTCCYCITLTENLSFMSLIKESNVCSKYQFCNIKNADIVLWHRTPLSVCDQEFSIFKSFHVRSKICFPIWEDLFLGNTYFLCKNSCLPLYHIKLRTSMKCTIYPV